MLGVRWYGEGLFVREELHGYEIAASKVHVVRQGDFVYNRLFAWKGSFAIVGREVDGFHVSNEFPCFIIDQSRIDQRWLLSWFKRESAWASALGLSSGATPTSRNRLKEGAFLSLLISLPPLAEQQRLMARIEAIAGEVATAKGLQHELVGDADQLCRKLLQDDPDASPTPLRDLVSLRPPDVHVQADQEYHFAGVYCFGRGVFVGERKTGLDFSYPRLTRLRTGDFVYPKLMAWEGAFGVVPPECDGLVVSTEFPVFELQTDKVLPEILDIYFRDPARWPQVAGASIGTNVRRRRLNPQDFLDHRLPLPPISTQRRIKDMYAEVNALKTAQAARRAELNALLPAILDRAFAGAL
jgi:type I restriction enzyme S subunit